MTHPVDPIEDPLPGYVPVPLASRRNGWTAQRQRHFLTVLAETGSISTAAQESQITPRSAYRLRAHPLGKAFAVAWEEALLTSTGRLLGLAFERATHGVPRDVWRNGELILQTRAPSDKLLIFLLTHLMPKRFGPVAAEMRGLVDPVGSAHRALPARLAQLTDVEVPCDALFAGDFDPEPPIAHSS